MLNTIATLPRAQKSLGTIAAIADGREKLEDFSMDELQRFLRDARATLNEHPEHPSLKLTRTRQKLLAELEWTNAQAWPGRSGTTDKLAYMSVLGIAWRVNRTDDVGVSVRELGELIGVAFETARRALRRLFERDLLRRAEDEQPKGRSSRFNVVLHNDVSLADDDAVLLRNEVSLTATTTILSLRPKTDLVTQQSVPDAFRTQKGLGKTAYLVLGQLEDAHPQTASELATRVGKHRSTVSRSLRQLESAGLALETPNGWRKEPADLQQLAEDLGTAGAAERLRQHNAEQRVGYRRYLERNGAV